MTEIPPFLTGGAPFPTLDDWLADAALCARQNLRARESSSAACTAVLSRIDNLPADVLVRTLLRPEVFAFISMVAPPVGTEDPWEMLERALDARPTRPPGASLVWAKPTPGFTRILRGQGRGSRGESSANASFLDPLDPVFSRHASALEQAVVLLRDAAPGFAVEIDALVECVALVDGHASFRGASGLGFRGLVLLSPDQSWNVVVFAEELVHEATHLLLDLLSIREPLLHGAAAFEERWEAPFRPDKRPLYGNFHALVVVSRLLHLFRTFDRLGVEADPPWPARAAAYARRSLDVLATVQAHADLSPLAMRWMKALVEPTLGSIDLEAHDPAEKRHH